MPGYSTSRVSRGGAAVSLPLPLSYVPHPMPTQMSRTVSFAVVSRGGLNCLFSRTLAVQLSIRREWRLRSPLRVPLPLSWGRKYLGAVCAVKGGG
mgnify:CR=1 FL=1